MYRACNQFLAGAGLAGDEHRGLAWRHLMNQVIDMLHGRAVADEIAPAFFHFAAQEVVLLADAAGCQSAVDDDLQRIHFERTHDIVACSQLHRFDRAFYGAVRGHDDDRHFVALVAQRPQQFRPAHFRHAQIADDEVGGGRFQDLQCLEAVPGANHLVSHALQHDFQHALHLDFIIHYQNALSIHCSSLIGNVMVNNAPPSALFPA